MELDESKFRNGNVLYFHGTKSRMDKLERPSVSRPFFVCGDLDYAYAYSYAGAVDGRFSFANRHAQPGYVYVIELDERALSVFDASKMSDVAKLAKFYPKYVIDSIGSGKWSIWSVFSYINKYLFKYYSRGFGNVESFRRHLENNRFDDFFDNNLFFNGFKFLIERYGDAYGRIYRSGATEWQCLFDLITIFNRQLVSLGYNAFVNSETVSRVSESSGDRIVTNSAIGVFDMKCIKTGCPVAIPAQTLKPVVDRYVETGDRDELIHGLRTLISNRLDESETAESNGFEIVELTGRDLHAALPYIRPLIDVSYKKIGGKQGERSVEQLKREQSMAQVVYERGRIIAFALTKPAKSGGNRLNLMGCDQTWRGKLAMQAIIRFNIVNAKRNVWCECSGAIEHWFKKLGGYPIPNEFVPELIGEPRDKVWMHEDGIHYRRFLQAAGGRFVQKAMFGFPNEDIMYKVMNRAGYEQMKSCLRCMNESDSASKAELFITQFETAVKNGTITALFEPMRKYLKMATNIVSAAGNEKTAETGRKLLSTVPLPVCGKYE